MDSCTQIIDSRSGVGKLRPAGRMRPATAFCVARRAVSDSPISVFFFIICTIIHILRPAGKKTNFNVARGRKSLPTPALTLSHGAAGAKTCIQCAKKKTQLRSDYFAGAKRHNIVSTVAKRLRFRCRFFSSNSIPRRRRRKNMYTVCQKNPVAKPLFAGAKRLLRAPSGTAACYYYIQGVAD